MTQTDDLIKLWGEALKHPQSITLYAPVLEVFDHTKHATLKDAVKAEAEYRKEMHAKTVYQCIPNIAFGGGCWTFNALEASDGIQEQNYVEPYGCTGGDYYTAGELLVVCPKCGHKNRTYKTVGRAHIKDALKSVTDRYDK